MGKDGVATSAIGEAEGYSSASLPTTATAAAPTTTATTDAIIITIDVTTFSTARVGEQLAPALFHVEGWVCAFVAGYFGVAFWKGVCCEWIVAWWTWVGHGEGWLWVADSACVTCTTTFVDRYVLVESRQQQQYQRTDTSPCRLGSTRLANAFAENVECLLGCVFWKWFVVFFWWTQGNSWSRANACVGCGEG